MAAIKAKNGQVFVRKADGLVMGTGVDLGSKDKIKNYEMRDCTAEEMAKYYPEKPKKERKEKGSKK